MKTHLRTTLSLSEDEAKQLKSLIKKSGRSTADYLKRMALGYDKFETL